MRAARSRLLALGIGLGALTACDSQPSPARGDGSPGHPATPPPLQEWTAEPQELPPGLSSQGLAGQRIPPESWVAATVPAGGDPSGLEPGEWTANENGLVQEAFFPATRLSIRRSTQALPAAYRVEVTAWVARARGLDAVRDTGVVALIPYLRDVRHLVIVSLAPGLLEAWICDGQAPGQTWPASQRLWSEPVHPPRLAGQASTLTCEVDTRAGTLAIHLDGQLRARVSHAFLAPAPGLSFGLACNGSMTRFSRPGLWSLVPSVPLEAREPSPRTPVPSSGPAVIPVPPSQASPSRSEVPISPSTRT